MMFSRFYNFFQFFFKNIQTLDIVWALATLLFGRKIGLFVAYQEVVWKISLFLVYLVVVWISLQSRRRENLTNIKHKILSHLPNPFLKTAGISVGVQSVPTKWNWEVPFHTCSPSLLSMLQRPRHRLKSVPSFAFFSCENLHLMMLDNSINQIKAGHKRKPVLRK